MELIRACLLCKGNIETHHERNSDWGYKCLNKSCGVFHNVYFRLTDRGSGAIVCALTMKEALYESVVRPKKLVRALFFKRCVICHGKIMDGGDVSMCLRSSCRVEYRLSVKRLQNGRIMVLVAVEMSEILFNALLSGDAPKN